MKTFIPILVIGLIVAAFLGGLFYSHINRPASPQHLTLEQILSIRDLHLVKHTYNDLFFLHRKNNPGKPIRAIVQIPVTVTAYLNLKDIKLLYRGDSLKKVVLPHAILHEPIYQLNKMTVRETRGFQLHAGQDIYPAVIRYFGDVIHTRMDSARNLAIANRILVQAEAEGKMYVEDMLKTLGRADIQVTFNNEAKDKAVVEYVKANRKNTKRYPSQRVPESELETIMMGFLPLPR